LFLFFVQDDPLTNLQTAFEVAEKHLDIPQMLDAQGRDLQAAILFLLFVRGGWEAQAI